VILFETFRLRPSLPDDATGWVARMHARSLSNRERLAVRRWLSASPDHARDLLRAETVWRLSGALARDPKIQAELARITSPGGSAAPAFMLVGRRLLLRWAAVTCVALVAVAVLWHGFVSRERWYETATGEQRLITLADGSTVALNTATRVGIEYDARERRVWLEGGEALFQVVPDARRPFVVNAGTGWARAIGTRFNVALDAESVTVVVLEGVVEVAPKTSDPRVNTRLSRGESAAFGPGGKLTDAAPERASPERVVAWREGKVRFDGWSLEQAIAEHNRYARKAIHLGSRVPTEIRVSGTFRIGDTQAFLKALRELVSIQVVDTGDSLSLTLPTPVAEGSVQAASQLPDEP